MRRTSLGALTLAWALCAALFGTAPLADAQAVGGPSLTFRPRLAGPGANAQIAAGSLLTGQPRLGGPVALGTPVNYSWTVPNGGAYLVIATITYTLQSTTVEGGGGAAALRCNVHHANDGAIDISMASTSPGASVATSEIGEMTLAGPFHADGGPTPLTVTCENFGNAHSSVNVHHLQLQLLSVSGLTDLAVAP